MTQKELHEIYLRLPPRMTLADKLWGLWGAAFIGYTLYRLLTWS